MNMGPAMFRLPGVTGLDRLPPDANGDEGKPAKIMKAVSSWA